MHAEAIFRAWTRRVSSGFVCMKNAPYLPMSAHARALDVGRDEKREVSLLFEVVDLVFYPATWSVRMKEKNELYGYKFC